MWVIALLQQTASLQAQYWLVYGDCGAQGTVRYMYMYFAGFGFWWPSDVDVAGPIGCIRQCWSWHFAEVVWSWSDFNLMIHLVFSRPYTVCDFVSIQLYAISGFIWCATGFGPRTNPVPSVYCWCAATSEVSSAAATCIRPWLINLRFLLPPDVGIATLKLRRLHLDLICLLQSYIWFCLG